MTFLLVPRRAISQRSAIASVASGIGRLGVALVLAVLLCTAFGAVAQGHELTPTGTVEEVLVKGLRLAEASPSHLAVRGTGGGNSVRCDWRGIARTMSQREMAIRFWLGISATDTLPSASFLEILFTVTLDTLNPEYKETAKSNFLAIARGGLSTEYLFLTCFADYTASEYILGAGPTTLTVAYDRINEAHSYELYQRAHTAGEFGSEPLLSESAYQAKLDQLVWEAEAATEWNCGRSRGRSVLGADGGAQCHCHRGVAGS